MLSTFKPLIVYFAISIPLKIDLFFEGPISQMLSAITGLPIN